MLNVSTNPTLAVEARLLLLQIADAIIPRTREMPSASDADIGSKYLDRVLDHAPELARNLHVVLAQFAEAEVEDGLRRLLTEDRKGLDALIFVCSAAYYMSPDVQTLIGYHGQQSEVIDRSELPSYFEDGTLERVSMPQNLSREFDLLEVTP